MMLGEDDGKLDERQPLFGVFLIPAAINVASARCTGNLIALLFGILKQLDIRLIEAVVRTHMLHAKGGGHCRKPFECDNG